MSTEWLSFRIKAELGGKPRKTDWEAAEIIASLHMGSVSLNLVSWDRTAPGIPKIILGEAGLNEAGLLILIIQLLRFGGRSVRTVTD